MLSRVSRSGLFDRWIATGATGVARLRERILYRLAANLAIRARLGSFLSADVDYAIQLAEDYVRTLDRVVALPKAAILELGPGINFGPQLILASYGTKVTVSDRFLSRWHPQYHPKFYRELKARWRGPSGAIDRVLQANGYPSDVIACVAQPAEALSDLADGSFDCVISNAVLEHVYEPRAVAASLARVTRPGGHNLHQIDFRDHKDFRHPLEFLLFDAAGYRKEFERTTSGRGNRWRMSEWIAAFESAGLRVDDVQVNEVAPEPYFREFLPRLRRSETPYRDWPEDDLKILGARVHIRR